MLPVPGEMLSLCPITVWGPPRGPFGDYTGYDLRYFLPDGNEMVINKRGNEFFQLVTDEVRSLGPLEDILVQVHRAFLLNPVYKALSQCLLNLQYFFAAQEWGVI